MSDQVDIEIRLVSHPGYVRAVRCAIESVAQTLGADEQARSDVALATAEAVANVINHGYKGRSDGAIWVKVAPRTDGGRCCIEIAVEDECEDVDLSKIKGRPLEQVRPGGLGVHIIERVMDEVTYSHRSSGPGVRLTMRKFLEPAPQSVHQQK